MYGLYGLKHQIVEISGDVTDAGRRTLKIELLSQSCWMLSFAKRQCPGVEEGNVEKLH